MHRWYHTGWGRYTQADPVGARTDRNLYRYTWGNPVKDLDVLGLYRISPDRKCQKKLPSDEQCQQRVTAECVLKMIQRVRHRVQDSQPCKAAILAAPDGHALFDWFSDVFTPDGLKTRPFDDVTLYV